MNYKPIEEHYNAMRSTYIKRISRRAGTPEAAEDVVQEAYARALKYSYSFIGGDLDKWMSTIIGNALRDYMNMERGHSGVDWSEEETAPEELAPAAMKREVLELISTKKDDHREVLEMFYKQEHSAMDISQLTEHSYAKCHKIIQRFREELKELYKDG